MFRALCAVPIALLVMMTGCAIHPLPEDVTGVSTYNIVRQIRCEARQAVFEYAINWLTGPKNLDPQAREIGNQFREGLRPVHQLSYKLFTGEVRRYVQLFAATGIAYNFQLQALETNNVDPTTNLLTFSGRNTFSSPVNGAADRTRQNLRTFTVTDTFEFLINNIPDDPANNNDYCSGYIKGENYIYPVAGKVGIDRMISDFVNLTLFGGLGPPPTSPSNPNSAVSKGPPTMVDQLQFVTTVSLGATPKVTFAPVRTFVDASVLLKAARTDTHTVTIGLALQDKASLAQVAGLRSEIFAPGPLGPLLFPPKSASAAETAAAIAVNQVLTQQVFKPVININTN
jgi:hypothetical protein